MNHWSTIIDALECGINGDKDKCREYVQLLIERLHTENTEESMRIAQRLGRILTGKKSTRRVYLQEEQI